MPVNLVVRDRKLFSQLANGENFNVNLGDFATHLKGSAMEFVKMTQTLDVDWKAESRPGDGFTYDSAALTIVRASGDFLADGFSTGDTLEISYFDSNSVFFGTWTATAGVITKSTIFLTGVPVPGPGALADGTYTRMTIRGTTPLTGLIFDFGLIENNETFNTQSKVSGNNASYYATNITGVFSAMIPRGQYKDWQTGSAQVRSLAGPNSYTQRFEIEHIFQINPWYVDGELNNLINNIVPALYLGSSSPKYAYQADFRVTYANPNTSKIVREEQSLGSVAWFNENFNGFNNRYSIKSVAYTDLTTTLPVASLQVGGATVVKIRVECSLPGTFQAGQPVGIYFSHLPLQAEYTNKATTLPVNFRTDQAVNDIGAAPVNKTRVTGYMITLISPTEIEIEYIHTFTSIGANNDVSFLTNQMYYLLAVQVGDDTLITDQSDKVVLLADTEQYTKSADIPDLMEAQEMEFYKHPTDISGAGLSDYKGWIEDGIVVKTVFNLNLNAGFDAFLNQLNGQLVAYNPITGSFWVIQDVAIDINTGQVIVPSGAFSVQQISVNTTRGFNLAAGDQFNLVQMTTDNLVGGFQFYTLILGLKIDWQTWIADNNVDPVFFNNTEPNNNLNKKVSNYFAQNGYQIQFWLRGQVAQGQNGPVTDYAEASPNLEIYDYDLDDQVSPLWTGTIQTLDQNDQDINCAILTDEDTKIKVTWDFVAGPISSIADYWGIVRIEEQNNPGYGNNELSTLVSRLAPANNILIGPASAAQASISLVGGDVIVECEIDHTQLDPTKTYEISARLGNISNDFIIDIGKQTEAGVQKQTEAGLNKTLD